MTTVSFPGLGIGEFSMNPVAFTLFGKLEVRWYGILITFGMVLAFMYVVWRAKKSEKIKPDDVMDTALLCVVLSIIGARLYYVLTSLRDFHSLQEVLDIRSGGLAIYGGVIGGALGILIMGKIKKLNLLRLYDVAVPAVILAQAIGRWGNFVNGEAYGYPIVDGTSQYFFFLKEFTLPAGNGTLFNWLRMGLGSSGLCFHPTFLYECVWNLLGFGLLNVLYRKKKFNGEILLSYLAWYGFGRMFIEGLRTDSLYIFNGIFGTEGIRISQLVGLLCFVLGGAALIAIPLIRRKHPEFLAYKTPTPEPATGSAPAEAVETPAAETPAEPAPAETAPAEQAEQPAPAETPKKKRQPAKKPASTGPKKRSKGDIYPVSSKSSKSKANRKKRTSTSVKVAPKSEQQGENDHADH